MDRIALLLTGVVVVVVSAFIMPEEFLGLANALYSIPPTNAWQTIEINNSAVWPNASQNEVSAVTYKDKLYLLTDGSILLNITEYTP